LTIGVVCPASDYQRAVIVPNARAVAIIHFAMAKILVIGRAMNTMECNHRWYHYKLNRRFHDIAECNKCGKLKDFGQRQGTESLKITSQPAVTTNKPGEKILIKDYRSQSKKNSLESSVLSRV
jgi:hypothetical protein